MPHRIALAVLILVFLVPPPSAGGQSSHAPPYVPTPAHLVDAMLELGALRPGDVVYDLGSGDGRIVITAAQRGARGVGVEYEAALVARSWALADSLGVTERVDFRRQDLFETDLSDASLVTLYLGHEFNLRLRPLLLEQLRPGSRVVSHAFHMGDWEPDSTMTIGTGAARATLYSWIVPADVDGFWYLEVEREAAVTLELLQQFQRLHGEVRRVEGSVEAVAGEMLGRSIRFQILDSTDGSDRTLTFTGRLSGERMSGVVTGPAGWPTRRWSAVRFTAADLTPEPSSEDAHPIR